MTPERFEQIEELFHTALALAPDERAAFLTRSCDGDENLRREVETLLESHELGESFIEQPAADVAADLLAAGKGRLEAGHSLAHYAIKGLLGAGGMGEVYLAEDVRLGRPVALKLLPERFTAEPDRVRRFEREARAASALNHPNIVTIHEIEQADSLHFIATEFVDGRTLREHMADARVPVCDALDIAVQVASALAAAHEAGIVHRDIKPENVMLRRDRIVKVLDFGLAKLLLHEAGSNAPETRAQLTFETHPGIVMGTARYMSPEQARGLDVDARTDLWSLGVVLYEMVAGRKPFEGATPTDVIISIAEREPEPLAQHAPEAPPRLERILSKALAKERAARYLTAKDLLADLKALRRDLETGDGAEGSNRAMINGGSHAAEGRAPGAASRLSPLGLTRGRTWLLAALVGLVIIAGLVASRFIDRSPTTARRTEIKSLAVLPLETHSGDASQDYFADGMTEALINDLVKVGALRVMSRTSVMQYKGARRPASEVGRELNVEALLKGSVARSGGAVRVSVELVHAASGQSLWARSYERDLRDVLSLQREVVGDVVGEIGIKSTGREPTQTGNVRPVNPEAYDLYLRGQFYLHRQSRDENEKAINALERAVATDPTFAAAHAELAQAYVWKLFLFAPNEKQWAEKAFVEAEKALAIDPDSAVAYLARGRLLWTPANRFPHEKAIREYRRALTLDPSLDEARNQLALVYNHIGAFEEALQELERAVAIDPSNHLAQFRIGETYLFQGRYEQALDALRSVPSDVNPALVGHQIAWALFNLGRRDEASATIEQFLRDYPEDNRGLFTAVQAVLAASAGQERAAEERIKLAVERGKGFGHFHHTAYYIACAYARMNRPEQAVKWLEATAEDGFPCYPLFERDANLDNLRQDTRFNTFMARQRQQWEHYRSTL